MEGITRLSLRDVKIAKRAGYRIKLIGRAVRLPGEGRTAYVAPHLIPEEHPLANVEDVYNAIVVRGNATGEVMVNCKTTAVRLIPAPGRQVGDSVELGGLLGTAPVIPVHPESAAEFISRGGRIPAPLHSLKN